jgi:hypothetical protein
MDYELAKNLMDAGFPQIGKGSSIGSLDKLVWRISKVSANARFRGVKRTLMTFPIQVSLSWLILSLQPSLIFSNATFRW